MDDKGDTTRPSQKGRRARKTAEPQTSVGESERAGFVRRIAEADDARHAADDRRDEAVLALGVEGQRNTELRAREDASARLAAIVSSSEDAIISKDLDGIITTWNTGAERLFGYAADEVIGKSITVIIPDACLDEEPKILQRIRRGEMIKHYETVRRRKDGSFIDISLTVSPLKDSHGRIIGASKIARDITTRTAAEAALRAKDVELQFIADTTPVVLVRCGRDLKYKFINKAGADLFGLKPEQMVGKSIIEIMGKKGFAAIQPYVRTVLRGEPVEFEAEVAYPAGRRFVRANYEPERDERGKVTGWVASIVDITEIKAAQKARQVVEERFSRFMHNLPGLAWIKDLEGRYVYANDAAIESFHTPRTELYGRIDGEVFAPDQAARFRENDRRALEKGAVENIEAFTPDDGTLHHSLVTKFIISGPDEKPEAIGGMAIDITERIRAEEELRRSQEELKLAHDELEQRVADRTRELAEATRTVMRQAEEQVLAERQRILLLRKVVTVQEDERGHIARNLHDQLGQRLTGLRLKIASLQEMCAGDAVLEKRAAELQQITEQLDDEVGFLVWEVRPLELEGGLIKVLEEFVREWATHTAIAADFTTVGLDGIDIADDVETVLYRVAQEALNNAAKYSNATRVDVMLQRRSNDIVMVIEDNGIGFDSSAIKNDAPGPRHFGLTGMRERVNLISGVLQIESKRNKGTGIFVSVPLVFEDEHSNFHGQKPPNSPGRRS